MAERPAWAKVVTDRVRRQASITIIAATAALFLASWYLEPQSLSHSALYGMLPFAAVLAIVAMGQTLVIQQGGIDLSVPGMVSLTVVIVTHFPEGDNGRLATAILYAFGVALAAGLLTGFLVSKVGVTPIVTTLGMNALLYGCNLEIGAGAARTTTPALQNFASSEVAGIPTTVVIAIVITGIVAFLVKRTVSGRWFEAVGANAVAARAAGVEPSRYRMGAYVGASLLYCCGGILLAGIVNTPSAFQGDSYLLPSVAAVVLGGTSLLGGVGSVVASSIAAVFLSQLDQLILTTGVSGAMTFLIQAAALAAGVVLYGVHWTRLRSWFAASVMRRPPSQAVP
jgi:ribose transport system permease protein